MTSPSPPHWGPGGRAHLQFHLTGKDHDSERVQDEQLEGDHAVCPGPVNRHSMVIHECDNPQEIPSLACILYEQGVADAADLNGVRSHLVPVLGFQVGRADGVPCIGLGVQTVP